MRNNRKILFVHHGLGVSGADRSLLYLIRGLKRSGSHCIVACINDDKRVLNLFRREGFETIHCRMSIFRHTTAGWNPLWNTAGMKRLISWRLQYGGALERIANLINRTEPDIVHFNSLTLAPYLAVCGGVPAVLHVRERVHPGSLGLRKKWLKDITLRHASAVIYICKDNRDHLTGNNPIGRVVYNPVDFGKFDRNIDGILARKKVGVEENEKMILFLGGSGLEIKGILPFLHSLRILKKRFARFKCYMLGVYTPPGSRLLNRLLRNSANLFGVYSIRQKIERCIAEYGLDSHVVSLPFKTNVEDYYAAADVVAVPFTEPHFARQVIEAGAMAKPVAASRIGGVEEVVRDNETGMLAPPGDPEAMAEAICKLLNDGEVARKMGESAWEIARRKYGMEISAGQVNEIYESCEL